MAAFPETSWDRIDAVLDAVWDAEPSERERVLDAQCAGDPALRRDVETLLRADDDSPSFLDQDAISFAGPAYTGDDDAPSETETRRIGPYRLVDEVGTGGMSRVYRAERIDGGFDQQVAVKLLPLGLDTDEARRRFRVEQQVLADLQHPHIAQLLDGGITDDGVPYLVMEYVEGTPITSYCDAQQCTLDARIDLLCTVGNALRYAHRNLVVHRDLKPSNILVVDTDDGPQVKLLDFGIAKLLGDETGVSSTFHTKTGVRPMTPAYAAPEQMRDAPIRTTTDVYQFGVLAYELLAGQRPFAEHNHIFDIEQAVLETLPTRPSTAVRAPEGDAEPAQIAEARGATTADLQTALRGDLDAILLKALRKEPDERYDSIDLLLSDLHRYRTGEPVRARSSTAPYRARKFVERHRWGVAVAAAFVLTVAVGIAVLVHQRNRAQQQAQKAERVSGFLSRLFEAADPHNSRGDTVTARMLMREGRDRLDALDDQPAVQAEMMYVLGQTHRRLALYDEARQLLRRSLELRRELYGPDHSDVAESLNALALFERDQGHFEVADSLLSAVVSTRRRLHGPRDSTVAAALMDWTYVQRVQAKHEAAESSIRKALSIERATHDAPTGELGEMLYNLAAILRDRNAYAQAEDVQRRSLAIMEQLTEGPHPGVAANLNNLGLLLDIRERDAEADSILRRAVAMNKQLYGKKHPEVATSLANLADVNGQLQNYAVAESLYTEAVRVRRAIVDGSHPHLVDELSDLAALYSQWGKTAQADSVFRRAQNRARAAYGPDHAALGDILRARGTLKIRQDSLARAEQLAERAVAMDSTVYGLDHPETARSRESLADVRRAQGRLKEAVSLYDAAYATYRSASGADTARAVPVERKLGTALAALGRYARAETVLARSYQALIGHDSVRAAQVRRELTDVYEAWGTPTEDRRYAAAASPDE